MDIWPHREKRTKYQPYMVSFFLLCKLLNYKIVQFLVTKDKRIDLSEKQTSRNVFFCRLIGPKGAGKSSFMKRFIGKTIHQSSGHKSESIYNNYVVNSMLIYNQKKYLIVSKIKKILKYPQTQYLFADQGNRCCQCEHTFNRPRTILWCFVLNVWPIGPHIVWVHCPHIHGKRDFFKTHLTKSSPNIDSDLSISCRTISKTPGYQYSLWRLKATCPRWSKTIDCNRMSFVPITSWRHYTSSLPFLTRSPRWTWKFMKS